MNTEGDNDTKSRVASSRLRKGWDASMQLFSIGVVVVWPKQKSLWTQRSQLSSLRNITLVPPTYTATSGFRFQGLVEIEVFTPESNSLAG